MFCFRRTGRASGRRHTKMEGTATITCSPGGEEGCPGHASGISCVDGQEIWTPGDVGLCSWPRGDKGAGHDLGATGLSFAVQR